MLNSTEYIILARNWSGEPRGLRRPDANTDLNHCLDGSASKGTKPADGNRPAMRIWGMVSERDEEAGFRAVLDDSWYVLLQYRDKTVALFDPYDYTLPELKEKLEAVIRVIRRNPFLIGDGTFFWSEN
ncbi:MAG: hypothetical protein FJZ95_09035 [Chloroflexi bacterium]|nr:hypothetical protein [Chloroflexota bacterium]